MYNEGKLYKGINFLLYILNKIALIMIDTSTKYD